MALSQKLVCSHAALLRSTSRRPSDQAGTRNYLNCREILLDRGVVSLCKWAGRRLRRSPARGLDRPLALGQRLVFSQASPGGYPLLSELPRLGLDLGLLGDRLLQAAGSTDADKGGSSRTSWSSRALREESEICPGLPTQQASAPAILPKPLCWNKLDGEVADSSCDPDIPTAIRGRALCISFRGAYRRPPKRLRGCASDARRPQAGSRRTSPPSMVGLAVTPTTQTRTRTTDCTM